MNFILCKYFLSVAAGPAGAEIIFTQYGGSIVAEILQNIEIVLF